MSFDAADQSRTEMASKEDEDTHAAADDAKG
jgi:hypothetical protein